MAEQPDERLARLEAHVAHLERLCEQLNEAVTEQGKDLARLKKQQSRIAASVESMELDRIKATNPKPPHYQ
jgi:uncharacterized coiled-coil protein SlyX